MKYPGFFFFLPTFQIQSPKTWKWSSMFSCCLIFVWRYFTDYNCYIEMVDLSEIVLEYFVKSLWIKLAVKRRETTKGLWLLSYLTVIMSAKTLLSRTTMRNLDFISKENIRNLNNTPCVLKWNTMLAERLKAKHITCGTLAVLQWGWFSLATSLFFSCVRKLDFMKCQMLRSNKSSFCFSQGKRGYKYVCSTHSWFPQPVAYFYQCSYRQHISDLSKLVPEQNG